MIISPTFKLIAPYDTLFDDYKVAVSIFLNDRALSKVLGLALSTMIRAFSADDVSVLMLLQTISSQAIMI